MEKIEVAVRLRPLHCNPAELNDEYLNIEEVGEIWRIEQD